MDMFFNVCVSIINNDFFASVDSEDKETDVAVDIKLFNDFGPDLNRRKFEQQTFRCRVCVLYPALS